MRCGSGEGGFYGKAMGDLYMKELAVAGAAALGKHTREPGEGDHKGK